MGLGGMQVAIVVCLAVVVLNQQVSAQLASDWLPDLGSSGDASFDLGMESSGGGMCDGSMGGCGVDGEFMMENESERRLLRQIHYYIGYAALGANRIPCPPRSGRSYYTNNCYRARGPVRPYHRGCSAITRCRRDTS